MNATLTLEERITGGIWGCLVGDALGVPVEFKDRATAQLNPVTGLRGYGTHKQPPGTWSDDGSMTLCTVDSLLNQEFDLQDMGRRFVEWVDHGLWTVGGEAFDIGMTTSDALLRIKNGTPAENAGGCDEFNNGNGSLMRILPIAVRFSGEPVKLFVSRLERASAITHGHAWARAACVFYGLFVRELLTGRTPQTSLDGARREFEELYKWGPAMLRFRSILEDDLAALPEGVIGSSGFALHTLHASLWCLLKSNNYSECMLRAVNLGYDTDTTGCVAGGLAGIAWGLQSIPDEWISGMARNDDLGRLIARFSVLCAETAMKVRC